jgi:hypothetical protein
MKVREILLQGMNHIDIHPSHTAIRATLLGIAISIVLIFVKALLVT